MGRRPYPKIRAEQAGRRLAVAPCFLAPFRRGVAAPTHAPSALSGLGGADIWRFLGGSLIFTLIGHRRPFVLVAPRVALVL